MDDSAAAAMMQFVDPAGYPHWMRDFWTCHSWDEMLFIAKQLDVTDLLNEWRERYNASIA